MEGVRVGVFDALATAWYTPERDQDFLFSEPYLSSKLIVELGIPKDIGVDTTWTGSFSVLGTRLRVSVEPTASSR